MITSPIALITHGTVAIAAAAGAWVWQANAYTAKLATLQTQYAQAQHRTMLCPMPTAQAYSGGC